jgi:hypothetical protein
MANQNPEEFVKQRLGALKEPEGLRFSAAQARILLEARRGAGTRRWVWKAALAAAMFLLLIALPAAKAVAQTGTLSPEAFFHVFRQAHDHIFWAIHHWLAD